MKKIFRANDWWQGKAALLMGMVYLFTAWFGISFHHFIRLSLLSILTICGFASLGYLLNDFFDIKKDLLAGKFNTLQDKSTPHIVLLFVIATAALFVPWLFLPFNSVSVTLIVIEISLFFAYSIPPLRLKERGFVGVLTDAVYAHSLPALLAAYTFKLASGAKIHIALLVLLVLIQTISGIRNILIHQFKDGAADKVSNTASFYASIKASDFFKAIYVSIILELAASVVFFLLLPLENVVAICCAVTIVLCGLYAAVLFRHAGISGLMNSVWRYFPNNVFEKWVPVALLLALSFNNGWFAIVALLHLALFNYKVFVEVYHHAFIPARDGSRNQIVKMVIGARSMFSFIINNVIYYGFLFCNVDLKKENISAMEYWRRQRKTKAR